LVLVCDSNSGFFFCISDAVSQSLKQNLTQVCCPFVLAFGKWQIALNVCCSELLLIAVKRACGSRTQYTDVEDGTTWTCSGRKLYHQLFLV
jgi:hypothetical protein